MRETVHGALTSPYGTTTHGCKLTVDQTRLCAASFAAHSEAEGLHIWPDGSPHLDSKPGADLSFWVPFESCLRYSRRGDWSGEVAFLDKLDAEDAAWAAIWVAA